MQSSVRTLPMPVRPLREEKCLRIVQREKISLRDQPLTCPGKAVMGCQTAGGRGEFLPQPTFAASVTRSNWL